MPHPQPLLPIFPTAPINQDWRSSRGLSVSVKLNCFKQHPPESIPSPTVPNLPVECERPLKPKLEGNRYVFVIVLKDISESPSPSRESREV